MVTMVWAIWVQPKLFPCEKGSVTLEPRLDMRRMLTNV